MSIYANICYPSHYNIIWSPLDLLSLVLHRHHLISTCMQSARLMNEASILSRNLKYFIMITDAKGAWLDISAGGTDALCLATFIIYNLRSRLGMHSS